MKVVSSVVREDARKHDPGPRTCVCVFFPGFWIMDAVGISLTLPKSHDLNIYTSCWCFVCEVPAERAHLGFGGEGLWIFLSAQGQKWIRAPSWLVSLASLWDDAAQVL